MSWSRAQKRSFMRITGLREYHQGSYFTANMFVERVYGGSIEYKEADQRSIARSAVLEPHRQKQKTRKASDYAGFSMLQQTSPSERITRNWWWVLRGSNSRPTPCKGAALPTELSTRSESPLFQLAHSALKQQA